MSDDRKDKIEAIATELHARIRWVVTKQIDKDYALLLELVLSKETDGENFRIVVCTRNWGREDD